MCATEWVCRCGCLVGWSFRWPAPVLLIPRYQIIRFGYVYMVGFMQTQFIQKTCLKTQILRRILYGWWVGVWLLEKWIEEKEIRGVLINYTQQPWNKRIKEYDVQLKLIESIFFHLMNILMNEAATDKWFVQEILKAKRSIQTKMLKIKGGTCTSNCASQNPVFPDISREVVSCFLLLFFTLLHFKTEGCPSEKHNAALILAALAAHHEWSQSNNCGYG